MVVPAPIEGTEAGVKRRTILVVEDEVLIRMMISEALRTRGFIVIETASAEEAMIVLESDNPIDVLLSDVKLPGEMDGLGLAVWVRKSKPEIRVVIATSYAGLTPPDIADALFQKPYDVDALGEYITELTASPHGD